jgi:hypothetical protein
MTRSSRTRLIFYKRFEVLFLTFLVSNGSLAGLLLIRGEAHAATARDDERTYVLNRKRAAGRRWWCRHLCVHDNTQSSFYYVISLRGSCRCNYRFDRKRNYLIMHDGFHCFAGKKTQVEPKISSDPRMGVWTDSGFENVVLLKTWCVNIYEIRKCHS